MPLHMWYWLFMALWVLGDAYWSWRTKNYRPGDLLLLAILLVLGWDQFGDPVK